jgi:hypothetical protein
MLCNLIQCICCSLQSFSGVKAHLHFRNLACITEHITFVDNAKKCYHTNMQTKNWQICCSLYCWICSSSLFYLSTLMGPLLVSLIE